jgi:PAS domain S-box-containing protein
LSKPADQKPGGGSLRSRAEERLGQQKGDAARQSVADPQRLVHELEVHQVELELQNAELVQARGELELALEQYTELYDFAPVGYFTLDKAGLVRAANLAGATLLGLERSRLLGRSFASFVPLADRAAFGQFLERALAGGARQELELRLVPSGADREPLYLRLQALAEAGGERVRVVAIDLSGRKQVEDELARYREHLEWLVSERTHSLEAEVAERKRAEHEVRELNASLELRVAERTGELQGTVRDLEAFSYSVSHDLRSPLRSINGFANLLLEEFATDLDPEGKRLLHAIAKRTVNMGTLIDDLLRFSRNSRKALNLEPVDMTRLAREVAAALTGEGRQSGIELEISALPPARADRAMIAQVLENLIGNALKFSSKASRPRVEVGSLAAEEREDAYFVRDNGIGFDMKYLDTIFGVFQRLSSTEDYEGTGVGLAIVEKVVTRHGGRVWAQSSPGAGATFFFSLPRAIPSETGG